MATYARMFFVGFSAVVGGFGVGYAALAAMPAPAPQMTSVSSLVAGTSAGPARDIQPPAVAPRASAAKPEAERTAPAPTRTVAALPDASPSPARDAAPAKSKRDPVRFELKDGGVSASLDPETRKLRVRTPFGTYSFGM